MCENNGFVWSGQPRHIKDDKDVVITINKKNGSDIKNARFSFSQESLVRIQDVHGNKLQIGYHKNYKNRLYFKRSTLVGYKIQDTNSKKRSCIVFPVNLLEGINLEKLAGSYHLEKDANNMPYIDIAGKL